MEHPTFTNLFLGVVCLLFLWWNYRISAENAMLYKGARDYLTLLNHLMSFAASHARTIVTTYQDVHRFKDTEKAVENLLEGMESWHDTCTERFTRSQEKNRELCELAEVISELLTEFPDKRDSVIKRLKSRDVKIEIR